MKNILAIQNKKANQIGSLFYLELDIYHRKDRIPILETANAKRPKVAVKSDTLSPPAKIAGSAFPTASRESKAVGVLEFRVDYINTSLKRCVADVKIKGKVRSYAGEFKRIKIKTLNSVCER